MKVVAFFRNVNLGRANCPSKLQLEDAFLRAGADRAASFLTNGTIMFEVPSGIRPQALLADAHQRLEVACGLREPAHLRTIAHLAKLVAGEPFAGIDRSSVHELCASFLATRERGVTSLPLQSKRGDVEVIQSVEADVFSISRKIGSSPGSPNAFLEKLLGVAVTTRAWNTVVRLVERHG